MTSPPAASPVPPPALRTRWWQAAPAVIPALVLLVWHFQDVILRHALLTGRDTLQFYYPLFEYLQQELDAGRFPLWNPYANGGEPLLAAGTSSLLYPGKLIFFLPVSYWARYHLYTVLHVLWAALTCTWVARRWGASLPAAALSGISYAFCGNVLFQFCNIVFLCGASWLPLAFWSGDRLMERRRLRDVPAPAISLVMMVLCGNVELAYAAGMLLALDGLIRWRLDRRRQAPREGGREESPAPVDAAALQSRPRHRLLLLIATAGLAFLLAAPQLMPMLSVRGDSSRAVRTAPGSLWDLPAFFLHQDELMPRGDNGERPQWYDGFVGNPPPPADHALVMYRFSFQPWRLVEFLWPNVSGRYFPENRAWLARLEGRIGVWVYSQYMGLLPFLLGISAWSLRSGDRRVRWLSFVVLITLVASFGWYGPGRFFHWGYHRTEKFWDGEHSTTGGIGGLYWLLTLVLPGFADFRFPVKLMVPAACALSLLAAPAFDRMVQRPGRLGRVLLLLAVASAAAAIAVRLSDSAIVEWLGSEQLSAVERFDPTGAVRDIEHAFWHTAVIAGILAVLAWFRQAGTAAGTDSARAGRRGSGAMAWGLVALTMLDIGTSNREQVWTTELATWNRTPPIVGYFQRACAAHQRENVRPLRIFNPANWFPPLVLLPGLLPEMESTLWQRETLLGLQNMPFGISRIAAMGTLESSAHRPWVEALAWPDPPMNIQPRRALDAWGTEIFVLQDRPEVGDPDHSTIAMRNRWNAATLSRNPLIPTGPPLPHALPPGELPVPSITDIEALYNTDAFPPAWIVHRVHSGPPIPVWDRKRAFDVLAAMVFPLSNPFDLHTEAHLEDPRLDRDEPVSINDWPEADGARESCTLTHYEPQRLEVEANLSSRGLVVLSETYSPDWRAEVATDGGPFEPCEIYCTNRTMRGVLLPAGKHTIRMEYRPASFTIGLALSGVTMLLLIGLWLRRHVRRSV